MSLPINALAACGAAAVMVLCVRPAGATEWGVAAGSAVQSYYQAQENAAIETQRELEAEIARINARAAIGTPQLDRMQALQQDSDQIYLGLMTILRGQAH